MVCFKLGALACIALISVSVQLVQCRDLLSSKKTELVIIIFGDSISDTGRVLNATGGKLPAPEAYPKGRFTNGGKNWVDFLSERLSKKYKLKVYNYAFGGATACADPAYFATRPFVKDLGNQTAMFMAERVAGAVSTKGKTIYMQFIGTNDLNFALQGPTPPLTQAAAGSLIFKTVTCRVGQLDFLVRAAGAREIVVMPSAPIQASPSIPAPFRPSVAQLVGAADQAMAGAIQQVKISYASDPKGLGKTNVYTFGNNELFAAAGLVELGFKNTTGVCVSNPNPLSPAAANRPLAPCPNPNDYFLYDEGHPSGRFHQWLALDYILPRLQQARLVTTRL